MSTEPRESAAPAAHLRLTITDLAEMKHRGERIAMVTAYDTPAARLADAAGMDIVFVGDSAANNVLGYDGTTPISMDEMLMLARAARRGVRRAFFVVDMPHGSFQVTDEEAVRNAVRLVKEAGADAVKLEGGGTSVSRARAIVAAGIPVMGHIGLTPQSVSLLGGHRAQGRTAEKARALYADAQALQAAGCFAIVLEAVPARIAARITESLRIPTIGIGAGPGCDGQVLVWHDLLGITEGPTPRFVKRYAELGSVTRAALEAYIADVRAGTFPASEHEYKISREELQLFESELDTRSEVLAGDDWI
jgi:3-methyl-2-oxobutanoate hydroxymethyltransferase